MAALAATLAFLPALAADPVLLSALPGKARLANLEIEIWPEYDRPEALVFLKGELASGAGQVISLRLPASSGGPAAVAQSSAADGNLVNLPFERADAKDFITLRIQPQNRFFHVEFYNKIDTVKDKREYRYVWPGDLPVDHLSVRVQQPSGATTFAITPAFSDSAPGSDTLIYWTKDMGAVPAGKTLPISIRYAKSDARTSTEVLGPTAPASAGTPSVGTPLAAATDADTSPSAELTAPSSSALLAYWIVAAILALLCAVAAGFMWRRRRVAMPADGGTGFCTQCGHALRAGDRFCSKCGAAA